MASRRKDNAGYLSPKIKPPRTEDYVVVELRHESKIGYSYNGFESGVDQENESSKLNEVLDKFNVEYVISHFAHKKRQIANRVLQAPRSNAARVTAEFAHSGFVQLFPKRSKDCESLAKKLNSMQSSVWKAHVSPKPVPAVLPTGSSGVSRNFEPSQGYLGSAPNGIAAVEAWEEFDAKGSGVTICDIEGNWNFKHEDLPRIKHIGGDLIPDLAWRNHGTAVLGEMVSKPGTSGTVGISHKARAFVQSAVIDSVFNTAGAIANATSRLEAGDVILIELQATGPNGKYVAMQYWDDIFSAIRAAVDKGVCVVEAAGNGNENFDLPIFNNTGLQKDSGAIVVGAGIPPTNAFDAHHPSTPYTTIGVPRSRIWFSNYGQIVDVQAWGWHVTSCGYGDAQGGSENSWYTIRFSGTSSASPIVTGAVACIQGVSIANSGAPLAPEKVRKLLIDSGTPQESGPGVPLTQKIGPQPNLARAVAKL